MPYSSASPCPRVSPPPALFLPFALNLPTPPVSNPKAAAAPSAGVFISSKTCTLGVWYGIVASGPPDYLRADEPMSSTVTTETELRLVQHHSLCVLPFGFDQKGKVFERLEASTRWRRRTFDPENLEDAERTEYFLPYIRRFLFPSRIANADLKAKNVTCRHYVFDLASIAEDGGDHLRGTISGHDNQENEPFECGVALERVELTVFHYGVAFLACHFRCPEAGATYSQQMTSLGLLRMLAPLYAGQPLAVWQGESRRFHVPQLIRFLIAEFAGENVDPPPSELQGDVSLPVKLIHDDRMMVYAFSCIDRESCPSDITLAYQALRKRAVVPFDPESREHAGKAAERGLRAWQRVRWQGFAKDGGLLVAFNNDRFDETFLGLYHRTYYYDILVLATLQRFTLLLLYERLADIPGLTEGGRKSQHALHRLRRDLLLFKNQCCFSQITLRERGLVLWKKWLGTFENEVLLREVNEQSEELENYLRIQNRERIEWLVRVGGFVATAVPAILGLDVLLGSPAWLNPIKWVLLIIVLVASGIFASVVMLRKPKEDG